MQSAATATFLRAMNNERADEHETTDPTTRIRA